MLTMDIMIVNWIFMQNEIKNDNLQTRINQIIKPESELILSDNQININTNWPPLSIFPLGYLSCM